MAKKATAAQIKLPEQGTEAKGSPKKQPTSASTSKKTTTKTATKTTEKKATEKKTTDKASVLLTLTDIGDHIASTFDMPKSHAKIYLAEAVTLIAKNLRRGNKVRIAGLGVFQVKKRAARKGLNPSNGAPIKIKATKRVGFAVARDLKSKL